MREDETMAAKVAVGASVLCVLAVLGLSMRMNYQFGITLAGNVMSAQLLGLLSLAADGLKAVLPVAIGRQWRARQWWRVGVGTVLFALVLTYGFMSALGFAAQGRGEMMGAREQSHATYGEADGQVKTVQEKFAALGRLRNMGEVEADLRGVLREKIWPATRNCSKAAGQEAKALCERYDRLTAEKARVAEGVLLAQKLEALQAEVKKTRAEGGMQAAVDYQVEALRVFFGGRVDGKGLSWLLAILVEAVSAFGFLAVLKAREAVVEKKVQPEPLRLVGEPQAEGDLCHG